MFIWGTIDDLVEAGVELDYLQVFNISKNKNAISIVHSQEESIPFEKSYHIFDEVVVEALAGSMKVYVIDNIEHSIMILASEY